MDLDFGLLADAATVDAAGKLNVLGIFDRIQAHAFPARHGRVSLVLRFSAGTTEIGAHEIEIRLRGPDGEEILRLDGRMELAGGGRETTEAIRIPHVLNLDGITFPKPGNYAFDVACDGRHLIAIPLRLEVATGPIQIQGSRSVMSGSPPPFLPGRGGLARA